MFEISTDKSRLDIPRIRTWLDKSYWAKNIPRNVVEKSIQHSLCFAAYDGNVQIGFARVITDYATFAYISDVIVDDAYQGKGVGKQITKAIREHPDLQNLRRWCLVTADAHTLYKQFDFTLPDHPEYYMEILDPEIYTRNHSA